MAVAISRAALRSSCTANVSPLGLVVLLIPLPSIWTLIPSNSSVLDNPAASGVRLTSVSLSEEGSEGLYDALGLIVVHLLPPSSDCMTRQYIPVLSSS